MKKTSVFLFFLYQTLIKPIFMVFSIKEGASCRFYPTCSDYMRQSFEKYGFFKALHLSFRRILRCHPWSRGGVDLP